MILFYLIFLIITLAFGYVLLRRGQKVVERLKLRVHVLTIVDAGFLLLESATWLYLMLVTLDALVIEFSPGKPKPYFLVTWGLGIVAYGILSFIRTPVDALLRRRSETPASEED